MACMEILDDMPSAHWPDIILVDVFTITIFGELVRELLSGAEMFCEA